jgi:hypothetical protein
MQHVNGVDGLHTAHQLQQDSLDNSGRQRPAVRAHSGGEVTRAKLERQYHGRAVCKNLVQPHLTQQTQRCSTTCPVGTARVVCLKPDLSDAVVRGGES